MLALSQFTISSTVSLRDAMAQIDRNSTQIAVVVDADQRLLGTVTDGDIRRAILRQVSLDTPACEVMSKAPLALIQGTPREAAILIMRERSIHQLPMIDSERRVIGLVTLDDLLRTEQTNATVILMAGGLGTRLRPLTDSMPKPLLPVGGKPLIEITIENLARQGFCRFIISVNYKADMFRKHFGDGTQLGVDIRYIEEDERLGTAGALRLLDNRPNAPLIVMNGDILTTLDARRLIEFHAQQKTLATMCVRQYEWTIPYGVVRMTADGRLASFEEKPFRREFVNAGIYVLSPEALDNLPDGNAFDMPTLFETIAKRAGAPAVYPLSEYWLDIGHLDDLQRAQRDVFELVRMTQALVVGYGSIGVRHARALKTLGWRVTVVSRRDIAHEFTACSLEEGLATADYVIVANETSSHAETLNTIASAGFNAVVLVEKPLFASPAPLPRHRFASAVVGYNLRFHPVVRALRDELAGRAAATAVFSVGQRLSDWRPTRDVASTYSARRDGGGGVLRDLSHELDLATWLFGAWHDVAAQGGRVGVETLDADDAWSILLRCERCGMVSVLIDSLDRRGHRSITVQVDGDTLHADLVSGTFTINRDVRHYPADSNMVFEAMHRSVYERTCEACSLEEGVRVVDLIAAIEAAAHERRWLRSTAA